MPCPRPGLGARGAGETSPGTPTPTWALSLGLGSATGLGGQLSAYITPQHTRGSGWRIRGRQGGEGRGSGLRRAQRGLRASGGPTPCLSVHLEHHEPGPQPGPPGVVWLCPGTGGRLLLHLLKVGYSGTQLAGACRGGASESRGAQDAGTQEEQAPLLLSLPIAERAWGGRRGGGSRARAVRVCAHVCACEAVWVPRVSVCASLSVPDSLPVPLSLSVPVPPQPRPAPARLSAG